MSPTAGSEVFCAFSGDVIELQSFFSICFYFKVSGIPNVVFLHWY